MTNKIQFNTMTNKIQFNTMTNKIQFNTMTKYNLIQRQIKVIRQDTHTLTTCLYHIKIIGRSKKSVRVSYRHVRGLTLLRVLLLVLQKQQSS